MYQRQRSCRREKPLGPKPAQGFLVAFEVFDIVSVIVDVPFLENAIELEPVEAQQLTRLIVRKRTGPIPFDDKRLKGLAPRIRVSRNVIRKMDRDLHNKSLAKLVKI
jgi:hypothetical protein